MFIHDALLESVECGDTEVAARDLKAQYRYILYSVTLQLWHDIVTHRKLSSPSDDNPKRRLIEEEFKVGMYQIALHNINFLFFLRKSMTQFTYQVIIQQVKHRPTRPRIAMPTFFHVSHSVHVCCLSMSWLCCAVDDVSRCRISAVPGQEGSDYINASYIDVSQLN